MVALFQIELATYTCIHNMYICILIIYLSVLWATIALNFVPCNNNQKVWIKVVMASHICYHRFCQGEQMWVLAHVIVCHVFTGISWTGEVNVTGQRGHHCYFPLQSVEENNTIGADLKSKFFFVFF